MKTTAAFVEYIIIGAEVFCWLFSISACIDARVVEILKRLLLYTPILVVLIGFCYVIGLVFDLVFDWLLEAVFIG